MSVVLHPAKHFRRALPSSPSVMERLFWRSSWTGQRGVQPVPEGLTFDRRCRIRSTASEATATFLVVRVDSTADHDPGLDDDHDFRFLGRTVWSRMNASMSVRRNLTRPF